MYYANHLVNVCVYFYLFLYVLQQEWWGSQIIHWDVEEALNLFLMEVHGDQVGETYTNTLRLTALMLALTIVMDLHFTNNVLTSSPATMMDSHFQISLGNMLSYFTFQSLSIYMSNTLLINVTICDVAKNLILVWLCQLDLVFLLKLKPHLSQSYVFFCWNFEKRHTGSNFPRSF